MLKNECAFCGCNNSNCAYLISGASIWMCDQCAVDSITVVLDNLDKILEQDSFYKRSFLRAIHGLKEKIENLKLPQVEP